MAMTCALLFAVCCASVVSVCLYAWPRCWVCLGVICFNAALFLSTSCIPCLVQNNGFGCTIVYRSSDRQTSCLPSLSGFNLGVSWGGEFSLPAKLSDPPTQKFCQTWFLTSTFHQRNSEKFQIPGLCPGP